MQPSSHGSAVAETTRPGSHPFEELFAANLPLIDRVIKSVARQHRVSPSDADDFASTVYLRLIKDDYGVFRKSERGDRLAPFLKVVIGRICLDSRIQAWGRWRPSAEAWRQGATAIEFERLLWRDGLSIDQAIEVLQSRGVSPIPRAVLSALASRAPASASRRPAPFDAALHVADPGPLPETLMARGEVHDLAVRACQAIERTLAALEPEDKQLIELRFRLGFKVSAIARTLKLDQAELYLRFPRLLRQLRQALERELGRDTIETLLTESWPDLEECAVS